MKYPKRRIWICVWAGLVWSLAACQPLSTGDIGTPPPEAVAESAAREDRPRPDAQDSDAQIPDEDSVADTPSQPGPQDTPSQPDSSQPDASQRDSTAEAAETVETVEPEGTPTPTATEVLPTLRGTVTFTVTLPFTVTVTAAETVPVEETLTPTATAPITTTPPVTGTPPITGTPTVTATVPPGTPTPPASPVPSPTGSPTPIPSPTPQPTGVVLRTHRSFIEGSDRVVVGEVFNGTDAPVFGVRVIATFYDGGGQLVGAQETITLLLATQPRQANPFRLVLRNAPASIERYELTLNWDEIQLQNFDRVTIVSEEQTVVEGVVELHGELRNDHELPVANLQVVASFYDVDGTIVNVFVGEVDSTTLDPGQLTPYRIRTHFVGDSVGEAAYSSYLIQNQGTLVRE